MFTINLKASATSKDSMYVKLDLIFFKSGHNRVPKALGIKGLLSEWDNKKQLFKTDLRSIKSQERVAENLSKNKEILDTIQKYLDAANQMELSEKEWSAKDWAHCFDESYKPEKVRKSIEDAIDMYIDYLSGRKRIKNGEIIGSLISIDSYRFIKRKLNEFTLYKYNQPLSFFEADKLTDSFLSGFVSYTQEQGLKQSYKLGKNGGLQGKLKTLRAAVNYAIKHGMTGFNLNVFDAYKQQMQPKIYTPEPMTHEEMMKIEEYANKLPESSTKRLYFDLFLFSFYTGGMSNIDVVFLKKDCIKEDRIIYERMKCHRVAKPILIKKSRDIIKKHSGTGYKDYVFPIITAYDDTEIKKRCALRRTMKNINSALKQARKILKIKTHITWYTARSTFITKMVQSGFNVMDIAEMAGNSPEMIQKHYFAILDQDSIRQKLDSIL